MERIFTLSAGTPVAAAIAAVITATSSPSFAALPAAGAAVRAGAAAGALLYGASFRGHHHRLNGH